MKKILTVCILYVCILCFQIRSCTGTGTRWHLGDGNDPDQCMYHIPSVIRCQMEFFPSKTVPKI